MEFHGSHPLDNITRKNPYSMLEALIPFVDYPMKLPLALLVKYYEVRLIINAFQSADAISRYGLHNASDDPMDMLGNIMGISPDMLKTLMPLMDSRMFTDNNQFHDTSSNNSPYDQEISNITSYFDQNNINTDNNSTLDDNIKNIFAEYDLLQAAEYNDRGNDLKANEYSEPEYYI